MQQQQQQQQAGGTTTTTVPSPISSRPPAGHQEPASFEHGPAGDEGERGGSAGNRWPRQETLALLKIRSEMDAAFREAALKGPLWEEVSRKLAAMGYKRSAKKCREKFENVDKYYKRTKDGRAGRGDGKAYRFFSELEALHGGASSLAPTPVAMAPPAAPALLFPPPPPPPPPPAAAVHHHHEPAAAAVAVTASVATPTAAVGDVSFSSCSDDGEDTDETGGDGGKRKRRGGGEGGSSKMMRFFEGLMRQVMERQEEMQQRFIEAIERREQDRMIREEAWRRQEVARLAREQDALAQERAMAASRDAAVVSFIQRITGQTIPMPPAAVAPFKHTPVVAGAAAASIQPKPAPAAHPPPPTMPTMTTAQTQPTTVGGERETTNNKQEVIMVVRAPPPPPVVEQQQLEGGGAPSPSSSRWPKAEVHALIQLRTELEARYQDTGPKGPLWEDISAGMRRMGYNRSAKRCKEKWENINKYFKKVKESNKKRSEDSKTCPYYHQLDALYRNKQQHHQPQIHYPPPTTTVLAAVPLSSQTPQSLPTDPPSAAANNNDYCSNIGNGCAAPGTTRGCSSVDNGMPNCTAAPNKQDDMIMTKETPTPEEMPQPVSMNDSYVNDRMDAGDSDSMDDDEDDFDDDDEDNVDNNSNSNSKPAMHQYEIQFQRQHQQSQSSVVRPNAAAGAGSGPGPTGSFLTMVHH